MSSMQKARPSGRHVVERSRLRSTEGCGAVVNVAARRRSKLRSTGMVACVLLAGCVTVPKVTPGTDVLICSSDTAEAGCQARIAAASAEAAAQVLHEGDWQFAGRAALSGGGQGGNARIEWMHSPTTDTVVLSAPVTRQSWRLELTPDNAILHGMPGGPRSGPDAALLLREATRWEIPVPLLRHWVRGRIAPQVPVARHVFARGDGALAGFDQAGWRIEIVGRDDAGLPVRLNAEQPAQGHRVRLVIDQWNATTPH